MGLLTFSARHFSEYLHPFFLNFFFVQRAKFFHYYYYYIIFIYYWTTVDVSYFCRSCCCTRSPVPLPKIWGIFCLPRASSYCTVYTTQLTDQMSPLSEQENLSDQKPTPQVNKWIDAKCCDLWTYDKQFANILNWLCDEFSVKKSEHPGEQRSCCWR